MSSKNVDVITALDYFAFLVEDRMGRSAEIVRGAESRPSISVNLHEDAVVVPVEAHFFCYEVMDNIMHTFGVFIPFRVITVEGHQFTMENYFDEATPEDVDTPTFNYEEDDF